MKTKKTRYTVIGAGHGGKAMAAHLALMGFDVSIYNRTFDHVSVIKERGGIELTSFEGGPRGFASIGLVTSDIQEAIHNAEMIMVVVPSSAHADIAKLLAPYLQDGQMILLNPGRTCGAIEVKKILDDANRQAKTIIAEAETFIYASRTEGPARAHIFSIKEAVPLAAMPAIHTRKVLDAIHPAYPQFIDGIDVLHTGLNNMGAIFHPSIAILNAGWIEATSGDFQFYIDGVTPSVAHILEVLDRERVTVASSLGIRARSALDWMKLAYDASGDNLYEAIHNQAGYIGIKAPRSLRHRYIFEDVPMSLVPIAALGSRYGVSVNGMDSVIRLANFIHRTNYSHRGRTLEKLGINDYSVSELLKYVKEGKKN